MSDRPGVMYELEGSSFEKGIFELRLERAWPRPLNWIVSLGPIRGRITAMTLLLLSAFLTFKSQPAVWAIEKGWIESGIPALRLQSFVTWGLMGVALALYFCVYVFRHAKLELTFDKGRSVMRYLVTPSVLQKAEHKGMIPFSKLSVFKVYSRDRDPKTPYGFIEIGGDSGEEIKTFRFKILSDDQFRIYPTNISRIIGRPADGDWVDPDSEMVSARGGGVKSKDLS